MPFMFPFLAFTGWDDIIIIMQNKLVAKVPQRERGKWEKSCALCLVPDLNAQQST